MVVILFVNLLIIKNYFQKCSFFLWYYFKEKFNFNSNLTSKNHFIQIEVSYLIRKLKIIQNTVKTVLKKGLVYLKNYF